MVREHPGRQQRQRFMIGKYEIIAQPIATISKPRRASRRMGARDDHSPDTPTTASVCSTYPISWIRTRARKRFAAAAATLVVPTPAAPASGREKYGIEAATSSPPATVAAALAYPRKAERAGPARATSHSPHTNAATATMSAM